MIFYEIELKSVPKIVFSHRVAVDNYKNKFPHIENLIEIALCEKGKVLFEYENGEKEILDEKTILSMFKGIKCKTSAYMGERQEHTTVGIVAQYSATKRDENCDLPELKKRVKSGALLIPYHVPVGAKYDAVLSMLIKIINLSHSEKSADSIKAVSEWFSLAGYLTDFVLEKLEKKGYSSAYITSKAKKYLNGHFREKITVSQVAKYLEISEGYLHEVFKQTEGMGIIQYVNILKIRAVEEYVKSNELSLAKAAVLVGVDDPAYLSRLFKKVNGMSYRQYKEHIKNIYKMN